MAWQDWFDENGWLIKEIPKDVVASCHHQGQCDEDCKAAVASTGFAVPRDRAILYLLEYGSWSLGELKRFSDERLAMTVLWLASGDIQDGNEFLGLVQ